MAHSYRNPGGRDSGGYCCESYSTVLCGIIDQCDNRFVFCLRNFGTAEDGNEDNCPLGRYETPGAVGDDDFSFATPIASGVPNPMTFTGSVWPVSIYNIIVS